MTWFSDEREGRPVDKALEKVLAQRAALVQQIETLKAAPLGKTQAAARFRLEDLTALAKKITAIDKKLGRV